MLMCSFMYSGLSTQPWRVPMLTVFVADVLAPSLGCLYEYVSGF